MAVGVTTVITRKQAFRPFYLLLPVLLAQAAYQRLRQRQLRPSRTGLTCVQLFVVACTRASLLLLSQRDTVHYTVKHPPAILLRALENYPLGWYNKRAWNTL